MSDPASGTAAWIAAARAKESARPDRLFSDPWAEALAGETGRARLAASERASGGDNAFLPVRTRFFDDVLTGAMPWARQVVLLGAGLDTRAYRLPLPPEVAVFEIDHEGPLAAKEALLRDVRPRCERIAVAADLRTDWSAALLEAGFDRTAPTLWLAEGLLCYLDADTVQALLTGAAELSQARAEFAADLFGTGLLSQPGTAAWLAQRARAGLPPPFCTDDPVALFERSGWMSCAITEPGQSAANFGRLREVPDNRTGGADPTLRTYLTVAASPAATS